MSDVMPEAELRSLMGDLSRNQIVTLAFRASLRAMSAIGLPQREGGRASRASDRFVAAYLHCTSLAWAAKSTPPDQQLTEQLHEASA